MTLGETILTVAPVSHVATKDTSGEPTRKNHGAETLQILDSRGVMYSLSTVRRFVSGGWTIGRRPRESQS